MIAAAGRMADAIRVLSMDAVQRANSGHPGMPMGMAEVAVALWSRHLRHDPADPSWSDRDRFVLSNGHGSMLLYSLLHLTGYDLTRVDLENFRRLGSRTPGHPERGYTPGVETTTGPLGQGLANAVGMALAERVLSQAFNRPLHQIVDHWTWAFAGDGCLMEGISHEACSLAGTLALGKLNVVWDDNGISIDGHVRGWFADDTPKRFEAYGWHVLRDVDGHDVEAVSRAIEAARAEIGRPSLICARTIIGRGAPSKAGSHESHGSPLGAAEIAAARLGLGWDHEPFELPKDVLQAWDGREAGCSAHSEWSGRFEAYRAAYPDLASEFERRMAGELPENWPALAEALASDISSRSELLATRRASQITIRRLADVLPEIVGGSADLSTSNLTVWEGMAPVTPGAGGNYVYYGVREFGMAAIMNGLAAHGGVRPFGGTYLVFSDYSRSALRMAALMGLGVIHVLTHDSIAVGQDGPTHQPIEHLASLRLIPGLDVWRPCDGIETAVAWRAAVENRTRPTVLALSRQALPAQARSEGSPKDIMRGGYVLRRETGPLDVVVIATGSEVALAVAAAENLSGQGLGVRVVSMPSTSRFDAQDAGWRGAVLPPDVPRVSVEAGSTSGWRKYVGLEGGCVGLDRFGESGAPEELFEHFGITSQAVVRVVLATLGR